MFILVQRTGKMGLYLRTLRHIPPQRVLWRLWRRMRQPWWQSRLYQPGGNLTPSTATQIPPRLILGDPQRGLNLAQGNFTFVGHTLPLGVPPGTWQPAQATALWLFNLHYFEWLADLRAASQRAAAQNLVASWLTTFKHYHPLAWHPYPLSLRVVSWLQQADWLLAQAPATLAAHFWPSLHAQLAHLRTECEHDLHGNHLLKNHKALLFGSVCLPAFRPHLAKDIRNFTATLTAQVHPDGGHDEASPWYQAQVLHDALDVQALLTAAGHPVPPELTRIIPLMGAALQALRHPDDTLALFNDSAQGEPAQLDALVRLSGAPLPAPRALAHTGYTRLHAGPLSLLADAGALGPAANPGHAHADALSFELYVGPTKLITNAGTHAYQTPHRSYFRSTAAHSTITLNQTDSAEVWGSFRVGQRYTRIGSHSPSALEWQAWHNGYRSLGVTHQRTLQLGPDGLTLTGTDTLEHTPVPHLPLTATAHFHLPPHVQAQLHGPHSVRLTLPEAASTSSPPTSWIFQATSGVLTLAPSLQGPTWGSPVTGQVMAITFPLGPSTTTLTWQLKALPKD